MGPGCGAQAGGGDLSRKRVVLAYSGGLDTSVAVRWLTEAGWEVVAVAIDEALPTVEEVLRAV